MGRRSLLDEPADLNADIGTQPWSRGVARQIQFLAKQLDTDVVHLKSMIEIARENKAWKPLGYVSLDAFLLKESKVTPTALKAIELAAPGTSLRDVFDPLAKHGGDRKSEDYQVDNVNLKTKGGNDTEYTLRRLKRDAPELLDKVEAGELSVNAAAIQAGIRKKPTPEDVCLKSFGQCKDKLSVARRIWHSLSVDQQRSLLSDKPSVEPIKEKANISEEQEVCKGATSVPVIGEPMVYIDNGTWLTVQSFNELQTNTARKAFFDKMLATMDRNFSSNWQSVYAAIDLMKREEWYWKEKGFKTFEDFWKQAGKFAFQQFRTLEHSHGFASMVEPELFQSANTQSRMTDDQ